MLALTVLTVLIACSGAPTGLGFQSENPNGVLIEDVLYVSPTSVWLSPGDSVRLSVSLSIPGESSAGVTYAWATSDPSVAVVSKDGVVTGVGMGSATIGVEANVPGKSVGEYRRQKATLVTVTTEEQEIAISRIFGIPPSTTQTSPTLSSFAGDYESIFQRYGDSHWGKSAGSWEHTYYDRGLAWYAAWWRTGNSLYIERGHKDILAYRDEYVLVHDGHVPPRWVFPEGLAVHYLLTGDSRSLEAIAKMADRMVEVGWHTTMTDPDFEYVDGRAQGRAVLALLIADILEAPGSRDWRSELDKGIQALIDWYAASGQDGSWTMAAYCGGQAHFQVSHAVLEALIRYHDLVNPRNEIPPIVGNSLNYMWNHRWYPEERAFSYLDTECSGTDSLNPATDLNLLIVWPFGWYYRVSGDESFRSRGDEIYASGLESTWFDGYKQFNQSFMRSYRYLSYRQ